MGFTTGKRAMKIMGIIFKVINKLIISHLALFFFGHYNFCFLPDEWILLSQPNLSLLKLVLWKKLNSRLTHWRSGKHEDFNFPFLVADKGKL